jgi:hypothetical protein
MIIILKRYGLVFFTILVFLCCANESDTRIRDYFNEVPVIHNSAFSLSVFEDFNYTGARHIDSTTLLAMYPDSMLVGIELNHVLCYPYGRYRESNEWFSVIVLREHGEWLKTLELMHFSNEEELLSIITLASIGGDMDYSFKASGEFDGSEKYNLTSISKYYEMDLVNEVEIIVGCDSSIVVTKIDQNSREIISREIQKYKCLAQ